ncbi:hypothetical protein QFC21_000846 [Naganishia friedmannii]|uniref:Uncharacterized protein n=1 Tax=Naganishia friedmannii TaxID=89922 RepID=A0ACC2W970_9TREE|nr:hypothetical protein QFC21_000846 [Naganishia friedmannii]
MSETYPYLAKSTIRYKSPHQTDLSFAKDETIRVTGPSPDDEDWLIGESIDGSRSGGFPHDFVVKVDEPDLPAASASHTVGGFMSAAPSQPVEVKEMQPSAGTIPAPIHASQETETKTHADASEDARADEDLASQSQRSHIGGEDTQVQPMAENIAPAPAPQATAQSPAPAKTSFPPISSATTDSPEKPSSFRDKLAAFNRSGGAGSPPPPLKPKPLGSSGGVGTWSWKQKQQQQHPSTEEAPRTVAVEPAVEHPQQTSAVSEAEPTSQQSGGMSASDAKASIAAGGSLRERMAALAGAGAFGGGDKAKAPPPPIGSKPRVWKRPEAPAGLEGAGPTGALPMPGAFDGATPEAGAATSIDSAHEQSGTAQGNEEETLAEDEDAQRREKERRAAIAARMAKLGGRGVMGMPMPIGGVAKVAVVQTEPEHVEHEDHVASEGAGSVPPQSSHDEPIQPRDLVSDKSMTESVISPPATIVMPAIPRKAGPPRRKAPARTDTAGSGVSAGSAPNAESRAASVSVPPLQTETSVPSSNPPMEQVTSPTTEGDDREIPLPKTEEQLAKEREYEEAGMGPRGVEGAERAGIALMPVGQATQGNDQEISAEDDDREIPIPKTAEEVAKEREYEEAGRGSNGAEGARRAGIALLPVGQVAQGEQARDVSAASHHDITSPTTLHHQRSLPPPPPPVDDDDEDNEGDGDKGEQDEIASDQIPGNTGAEQSPTQDRTYQPTQPIAFQPLHAPVASSTGTADQHLSHERAISPPNTSRNLLGLPKDEVEMKHHEAAAPTSTSITSEGERPKPSGPRPLPPSPSRAFTAAQDVPATPAAVQPPVRTSAEGASDRQLSLADDEDAKSPPPPRRQPSIRASHLMSPESHVVGTDNRELTGQESHVADREPEQPTSPQDADAIRRQGIAARMAKLGGIKLGGPPMFQRSAAASGESPLSPSYSGRNEILGSPTSPIPPPVVSIPDTESRSLSEPAENETEEQAAKRRQATLARLRAGGALGFGLFNNNPSAEGSNVEASPSEPSGHAELPPLKPSSQTTDSTISEDYSQVPVIEASPSRAVEPIQQTPLHQADELVVDEEMEEEAPPPPPRRSLSIKSPITSPNLPATAAMPSFHTASRSTSRMSETQVHLPESGLAPPLPPVTPGQYVQEPETMEEFQEAADEVGPPPPTRVREPSTPSRSSLDRSESRASRMSTSSRTSERGMPPASPVMGQRHSESGVRPNYNELKDASKSYGAKVARAAAKLIESGKKQTIGDGSPRALVWTAMSEAGLDANTTFGTLIWEQQGHTIQQRQDDIRIGDIVVLHDVKLKGKKGLLSYTQQAGSVQEPVFAVCSHVDEKKTKIKVYQNDRGHADNVTYRLDDLQSGLVRIFRPMPYK